MRKYPGNIPARRGLALIPTLFLMAILTTLIAITFRENMAQRRVIVELQQANMAFDAAEAGVQEALGALRPDSPAGKLERMIGDARFQVEWRPDTASPGVYDILSTGATGLSDPKPVARKLHVRASVQETAGKPSMTMLSWQE
jgi:hypothetical protein